MELPKSNSDYRDKCYWDDRYTTEDSYEWFTGYSSFKHLLKKDILPDDKILTLGRFIKYILKLHYVFKTHALVSNLYIIAMIG